MLRGIVLLFIENQYLYEMYVELRNVPKFSDRQAWANSADPDQSLIRFYTVCNSLCYFKEKPSCSTFRVITANFRVSEIL